MDRAGLRALLEEVQKGTLDVEAALEAVAQRPAHLDYASVDLHRSLRTGHPEVIYGAGKTAPQIVGLLDALHEGGQVGLVTRVDTEKAQAICAERPHLTWHQTARVIVQDEPSGPGIGHIGVVCAGTSDLPVAEEAAVVAEALGNRVVRHRDIGVAGLHRTLSRLDTLREASVLIVAAGMEGALPSVMAGLVESPVIAVPTSVGYGASFNGLAALLGMLNSCAPGVSVVNIDNGFGAAMQASTINRLAMRPPPAENT